MGESSENQMGERGSSEARLWLPAELPEPIRDAVAGFNDLPALAPVAIRVLEMAEDSEVSVADMCRVIGTDPGLTARIIRLANSASYYRGNETTSLERAASLLGVRTLKLVALCFTLIAELRDDRLDWEYLWRRSIATGVMSRRFASAPNVVDRLVAEPIERWRTDPNDFSETAFTAGLLSQVGRFALTSSDRYRQLTDLAGPVPSPALEREHLGVSVDTVTGYVLHRWGMPLQLAEAIGSRYPSEALPATPLLSQVLRAGDAAAQLILCDDEDQSQALALDLSTATAVSLGLAVGQVQAAIDDGQDELDELFDAFEFEPSTFLDADELVTTAQRQFVRLDATAETLGDMPGQRIDPPVTLRSTDSLTGLPNRRALDTFLANQAALRHIRRTNVDLGILLLQLDRFAATRNLLGLMAGDELIRAVGGRLFDACGTDHLLARVGVDRFVLVMPEATDQSMTEMAELLRSRVSTDPFAGSSSEIDLSVSVGGAHGGAVEASTAGGLMADAEAELLAVVEAGGDRASIRTLA